MKSWSKAKKTVSIVGLLLTFFVVIATSAYAGSNVEEVKVFLNHSLKFTLNGEDWAPTAADGTALPAIVKDGTTYVPIRAVAEAVGVAVTWNSDTNTIEISSTDSTSTSAGDPTKDGMISPDMPKPGQDSVTDATYGNHDSKEDHNSGGQK